MYQRRPPQDRYNFEITKLERERSRLLDERKTLGSSSGFGKHLSQSKGWYIRDLPSTSTQLKSPKEKQLGPNQHNIPSSVTDFGGILDRVMDPSRDFRQSLKSLQSLKCLQSPIHQQTTNNPLPSDFKERSTLGKLQEFKKVVDRIVSQHQNDQRMQRSGRFQKPSTNVAVGTIHEALKGTKPLLKVAPGGLKNPVLGHNKPQSSSDPTTQKGFEGFQQLEVKIADQILGLRKDKAQLEEELRQQTLRLSVNFGETQKIGSKAWREDNLNDSIIHRLNKEDRNLEGENSWLRMIIRNLEKKNQDIQQQYSTKQLLEEPIHTQLMIQSLQSQLNKKDIEISSLRKEVYNSRTTIKNIQLRSTVEGVRASNNFREKGHSHHVASNIYNLEKPGDLHLEEGPMNLVYHLQSQVNNLSIQNQKYRKQLEVSSQRIRELQMNEQKMRVSSGKYPVSPVPYLNSSSDNALPSHDSPGEQRKSSNFQEKNQFNSRERNIDVQLLQTLKNINKCS